MPALEGFIGGFLKKYFECKWINKSLTYIDIIGMNSVIRLKRANIPR